MSGAVSREWRKRLPDGRLQAALWPRAACPWSTTKGHILILKRFTTFHDTGLSSLSPTRNTTHEYYTYFNRPPVVLSLKPKPNQSLSENISYTSSNANLFHHQTQLFTDNHHIKMQYAFVAAALFSAVAIAAPPSYGGAPAPAYGSGETDTIYQTQVATITSCGPEVTNCPADKTSAAAAVPTDTCTDSATQPANAVPYSTPAAQPMMSSEASPVEATSAAAGVPAGYGASSAAAGVPAASSSVAGAVGASATMPAAAQPTGYGPAAGSAASPMMSSAAASSVAGAVGASSAMPAAAESTMAAGSPAGSSSMASPVQGSPSASMAAPAYGSTMAAGSTAAPYYPMGSGAAAGVAPSGTAPGYPMMPTGTG